MPATNVAIRPCFRCFSPRGLWKHPEMLPKTLTVRPWKIGRNAGNCIFQPLIFTRGAVSSSEGNWRNCQCLHSRKPFAEENPPMQQVSRKCFQSERTTEINQTCDTSNTSLNLHPHPWIFPSFFAALFFFNVFSPSNRHRVPFCNHRSHLHFYLSW